MKNNNLFKMLGACWVEIDLDAVQKNIKNIVEMIGNNIEIMGIVKGNAYGHDAVEVSKILVKNGVNQLAVARIEEAIILRRNNIKAPILVLSVSPEEELSYYLKYHIMPTISSIDMALKLNEKAKNNNYIVKAHIKVDTGMGRLGVLPKSIPLFIKTLSDMSHINIQGVFTHFSVADEADKTYTYQQYHLFKEVIKSIQKMNLSMTIKFHVANSAATLDFPGMWLDMIRPGCLIYGFYPSKTVKRSIQLFPALTFKSRISFKKYLPKGSYIGYGNTYKTKRETLVGTMPVGYADGYIRALSNQSNVLVHEKKIPTLGRICMDQTMIDMTDIPKAQIGDEVVLWGRQGNQKISLEEIAQKIDTIVDEIVHLTDKARVTKLFIKNEKPWKIKNMMGEYILNE